MLIFINILNSIQKLRIFSCFSDCKSITFSQFFGYKTALNKKHFLNEIWTFKKKINSLFVNAINIILHKISIFYKETN